MYRKILVGCDGSDHARDAVALAAALAQSTGASLTLACAVYQAPAYFPLERLDDGLRDEADGLLRETAAQLPAGLDCRRKVVMSRSRARALSELAEEEDADLIVLGASHRGAVGRVLAGNVGRQVLDGAPCAVAIAPAGLHDRGEPQLELIGVGFDGEPESHEALQAAKELAIACGAKLLVLTVVLAPDVVALPYTAAEVHVALEEAARKHGHDVADAAVASLSSDVQAGGKIVEGPIAASLEAAAATAGVDLLVVGSRGFGPLRRVLVASVSTHLMTASPYAVMVVPRSGARALPSRSGDVEPVEAESTSSHA